MTDAAIFNHGFTSISNQLRCGNKPLAEVCQAKGLDPATVVAMLAAFDGVPETSSANLDTMTLEALSPRCKAL